MRAPRRPGGASGSRHLASPPTPERGLAPFCPQGGSSLHLGNASRPLVELLLSAGHRV